jgi:hypothetical protein
MYADDSTLYRHIKTFEDDVKLQEDLSNILLRSVNNGMKLNAEKCKFMDVTLSFFRRYGKYNINGIPLENAEYVKMLGVYLSFNMSWNIHVEHIRAKCVNCYGLLIETLKVAPQNKMPSIPNPYQTCHVAWRARLAPLNG